MRLLAWSLVCLSVGMECIALAQPAVPNPPMQPDQPSSPAATSFSEITLGSFTPNCPLPPIPVSESTVDELLGLYSAVVMALAENYNEETDRSSIRGDGSDAGLHPQVNEFLKQGNPDEALTFAQTLEDDLERNENLLAISRAFAFRNRLEEAQVAALAITEVPPVESNSPFAVASSLRDQALDYVAQGYWNAGELDSALAVIEQVSDRSQLSLLLEITRRYQEQGQPAQAAATLEQATAIYSNLALPPDAADILQFWFLARLVGLYVTLDQAEQRSKAAELTTELFDLAQALPQQEYGTLNLLVSSVAAYRQAEQPEQAATALSYIVQNAEAIAKPYLRAMILASAAGEYAALGEQDRASDLLSQAQEVAATEDEVSQRNVSAIVLSQVYYQTEQPEQALQVTNTVEPSALREQVQQSLTCALSAPSSP